MSDEIEYPENNHTVTITQVRCEQCLYFKDYAIYKEKCSTLGIQPKSRPCKKFLVNARELSMNDEQLQPLFNIINKMSKPQVVLLTALLAREHVTRNNGHKFFDVVYIRKFGEDYISNYVKARVICVDSGMVYLRGIKKDKLFASVKQDSVYNFEQWEKHKLHLASLNRWRDPKLAMYTNFKMPVKSKSAIENYEPPNIDAWNNGSMFENKPAPKGKGAKVISLR